MLTGFTYIAFSNFIFMLMIINCVSLCFLHTRKKTNNKNIITAIIVIINKAVSIIMIFMPKFSPNTL